MLEFLNFRPQKTFYIRMRNDLLNIRLPKVPFNSGEINISDYDRPDTQHVENTDKKVYIEKTTSMLFAQPPVNSTACFLAHKGK